MLELLAIYSTYYHGAAADSSWDEKCKITGPEDTIIIRRLQIICLCVFTKIIIIFAPITCGRSGLINQVRERTIKNIENQMQFNIQFNPVSIMLLYYDCSNWHG